MSEAELPDGALDIRVTSGNPTEEEIAAATAVIAASLAQIAAQQRPHERRGPSAWALAQRRPRGPLPSAWRSFGG